MTGAEHARTARNYTERARRADHRLRNALNQSSSGSSSQERYDGGGAGGGGARAPHVSLQSTSGIVLLFHKEIEMQQILILTRFNFSFGIDLTAPDMHHLDLGDLDM